MSSTSSTQQPRRRVRTGCRTCRSRRRKCDEGKPVCENCRSKNLVCQYGLKFTFVQQKTRAVEAVDESDQDRSRQSQPDEGISWPGSDDLERPTLRVPDRDSSVTQQETVGTSHIPQQIRSTVISEQEQDDISQHRYEYSFDKTTTSDFASAQNHLQNLSADSSTENGGEQLALPLLPGDEHWQAAGHPAPTTPVPDLPDTASELNFDPNLSIDFKQEQREIDLLYHYRYHVAPVLDLGIGSLYFGVQVLLDLKTSPTIYSAVLSLSHCHRTATDEHYRQADTNSGYYTGIPRSTDNPIAQILLLWREAIAQPPTTWLGVVADSNLLGSDRLSNEHRLLLSRFMLCARLLAPPGPPLDPTFYSDLLQLDEGLGFADPQTQLLHSLILLEHTLSFIPGNTWTRALADLSLLTAWQTCWHESQMWFASRCEELGEILGLSSSNMSQSDIANASGLPVVVFSSGCALVANIAHHLTAMLLLYHKPRLVKPSAGHTSSTSPTWHVQRIIGMAAVADDNDIWDPIIVAALIHAARRLSHRKQLSAVTDVLHRICKVSGMQLEEEIRSLTRSTQYG